MTDFLCVFALNMNPLNYNPIYCTRNERTTKGIDPECNFDSTKVDYTEINIDLTKGCQYLIGQYEFDKFDRYMKDQLKKQIKWYKK